MPSTLPKPVIRIAAIIEMIRQYQKTVVVANAPLSFDSKKATTQAERARLRRHREAHLAITKNWMVHYYNAGMRENAWRRDEEARFLGDLGSAFDAGLQDALRRLAAAIGLDYFGIDCAETRDGRLLVFEADVAMIVHAMDSEELYPYKKPAMAKLFRAFVEMLEATRAG